MTGEEEEDLDVVRRLLAPAGAARSDLPKGSCAVLAPLVPTEVGLCFLFERRPHGTARFAGHLSFPGGRIEPEDASPLDAALREAEEEIGFGPDDVTVLGHLVDTRDPVGRHVGCFVGVVDLEDIPEVAASPDEVAEMILVPIADLLAPEGPREPPTDAWPVHSYRATAYECRVLPSREHLVQYWTLRGARQGLNAILWGFTGGLVAHFLHHVYGWSPPSAPLIVERWEDLRPSDYGP